MPGVSNNRTFKLEIVKIADTTANNPEPKFRMNGTLHENGWYTPFEAEGGIEPVLQILKESKAQLRSFRAVLVWENYGDEKGENDQQ